MNRSVQKGSKKGRKKFSTALVFKYGIEVPRTPEHTVRLDKQNGNTFWQNAIDKVIKALLDMDLLKNYS